MTTGITQRNEATLQRIEATLQRIEILAKYGVAVALESTLNSTVNAFEPVTDSNVAAMPGQQIATAAMPGVSNEVKLIAGSVIVTGASNIVANVELDKNGCAWIEEIHVKGKTKTKQDVWKVSPRKDKDLVAKLIAESIALHATAVVETAIVEPTVAAGMPGAMPGQVAAGMPGQTATLPSGALSTDPKQLAIAATNTLVTQYKVDYNDLEEVYELFGAKTFESVPLASMTELHVKLRTWGEWLGMAQTEIAKILAIDPVNGKVGIDGIISGYGVKAIESVHHEEVANMTRLLEQQRKDWEAYRLANPVA